MSQGITFVAFPDLHHASPEGLLAMGGGLDRNTLVSAYAQGIFPWFNHDQPVLWWSPDPRLVLFPAEFKMTRSLRKRLRNAGFNCKIDHQFERVIKSCAQRGVPDTQTNQHTWITEEMLDAYQDLCHAGYAHSIEVYLEEQLVGGLYGIAMGKVFFGESMFSFQTDASKVALFYLCEWLYEHNYQLIDCQIASNHLLSLGAREISRDEFMQCLNDIDIQQTTANFGNGFTDHWQNNVIKKL